MADPRVEMLKEESIPQLLRQLSVETTTLVKQEIALAKIELSDKVSAVSDSAKGFGIAGIFGLGAFLCLTATIIAAISLVLPVWAAALIVTIVYGVIAAVAAQQGRSRLVRATPLVPQQTTQTIKDDIEWAKTRAQSSKK